MISQNEFHVAKQIKNDHEDIVQKTLKKLSICTTTFESISV